MRSILSPKELAEAIGASESSIKRWVDQGVIAAARTAGGHRRITLQDAVRFIRDRRMALVRPDILGLLDLKQVSITPVVLAEAGERLEQYLTRGDERLSRGLLLSLYLAGESPQAICDGPLRGAMERIGQLFLHRPDGVFVEHRAVDICIQALNQLRLLLPLEDNSPVALGGAWPGDVYALPSLCAAIVLAAQGYRAVNLGADVPLRSLVDGAQVHHPRLVWLSISVPIREDGAAGEVTRWAGDLHQQGAAVIIGGRELDSLNLPPSDDIVTGRTMADLASFARQVSQERCPA